MRIWKSSKNRDEFLPFDTLFSLEEWSIFLSYTLVTGS